MVKNPAKMIWDCTIFVLLSAFISGILIAGQVPSGAKIDPSALIRRSSNIIEGNVVRISKSKNEYDSPVERVLINVRGEIVGQISQKEISITYSRFIIPDQQWKTPNFNVGEHVILLIAKGTYNWELIGGGFGKFVIERDHLVRSTIELVDFRQAIRQIHNGDRSGIELPYNYDSQSDEPSPGNSKLGGEFSITQLGYYGPLSPTRVVFNINPAGALDKDGNAIPFSTIKTVVQRVIDTWNNVANSYATFSVADTPTTAPTHVWDGISVISFGAWNNNGGTTGHDYDTYISEVDVVLSKGYTDPADGIFRSMRWNTDVTYPTSYAAFPCPYPLETWSGGHSPIGPVDMEDVLAHEIGHGVGLFHVGSGLPPSDPKYYYSMRVTDYEASSWWEKTWRRSLENGDKAGKIYQDPSFNSSGSQAIPKLLLAAPLTTTINANFTINSSQEFCIESGKTIALSSNVALTSNGILNISGSPTFQFSSGSRLELSGTANIAANGSLIVPSAGFLKINPGTTFGMGSSSAVTCNGKLLALGSSGNRISFTSTNATPLPGDWGGITCSGGGPDTLTYCDIKYATTGLQLTNTTGTSYMQNDSVKYNYYTDYGVRVANTGTGTKALLMYKCGIINNDGPGFMANNAKVSITYSRIAGNGLQSITRGLYATNAAKVYLDSSRIQSNNGAGIESSSLNTRVSLSANEIKQGYNTVAQHGGSGIYVRNRSTAFLGAGSPGQMSGGKNNVFNSSSYNCGLINNEANEDFVLARHTYWGTYVSTNFCGYVDRLYPLTDSIFTPAQTIFAHVVGEEDPLIRSETSTSQTLSGNSDIQQWLNEQKNIVLSDGSESVDALCKLALYVGPGGAYPNALRMSWDSFLSELENTTSRQSLRSVTTSYRIQALLDRADYAGAINLSDDILKRSDVDDNMWFFCQTRKIFGYVGMGDLTSAKSIYDSMKDRGQKIDRDATIAMEDYLVAVSATTPSYNRLIKYVTKPAVKPTSYELVQNYPNPFNPVTTITYALPEVSIVALKVYNLLGQEVKTLVEGVQEPGIKSVTFDASALASGLYFYKLQAGIFTDIKKMSLTK